MRNFNLKEHTLNWMGRADQFRSASRGTLWPSEASARYIDEYGQEKYIGKCARAIHNRLTGVEVTNPPSAKSQVIFLLGNKIEEGIVEIWKQSGIWDNNSVRFEDRELNLSGEYDCILKDPTNNQKFGAEVKSFWGYFQEKSIMGGWEGRGSNRTFVPGRPKDENLMQAAIYADQTRDALSGFKLYYISRDNNDMQEFNVTVDDNQNIYVHNPYIDEIYMENRFSVRSIYERYREQNQLLAENTVPVRSYKWKPSNEEVQIMYDRGEISKTAFEKHTSGKQQYTDWHCDYCPYKETCWNEDGTPKD